VSALGAAQRAVGGSLAGRSGRRTAARCLHLLLALSPVFFALQARAQTYTVKTVPNPRTVDGGFVTDAARLLGAAKPVIEARLQALEQRTGHEVALVILPSIGDAVPKDFAVALFAAWGIGKKPADNGVLVLHVLDQRRVEIETGYGVEGTLPDIKCHWLIEDLAIPSFRRGQFAEGHDGLTRGLVYGLEHPEASRAELLSSAPPTGAFADVPAPELALVPSSPARDDRVARMLQRVMPTPLHALPIVLLFVLGRRRTRAYQLLYPNPRKRPLPKTAVLSFGVSFVWVVSVIWAAVGQVVWLHHAAALLALAACALVLRDARRTARLAAERNAARSCPRCRAAMTRLPDGAAEHLEPWQALEEELGAFDYDVWTCSCGERQLFRYDGASPRAECAACHHHTTTRRRVVIRAATQYHAGEATVTTHCEFCEHEVISHEVIPREDSSSSSGSSSSSSSSSSGSFGGGSSGGGGAGGSY
jgi:uncharacterized protein